MSFLFFQKTYLATFLAFLLKPWNQGDFPDGDAENQRDTEPHQKCDLLAFSSNPNPKKEKFLNTLIQLNSMCHIHNRHAIKMTNISLK